MFSLILHILALYSGFTAAKTVSVNLVLSYGLIKPDGYEKTAVLINGGTPGPEIRVGVGDTCIINVQNDLFYEGASIHVHGMYQNGSNQYDGVAYGTQWPIQPGNSFTYKFIVSNRPGTYFYHAHYQLQSQAVYGAFIVEDHKPPYYYDEERIMMLADWYHESDVDQLAGLMSPTFKWIGDPQSILVNGKGRYDCSLDVGSTCNLTGIPYEQITIQQGKTYRLRFIGATSLSYFQVSIQGHSMKIIEADGIYVEPYEVASLEINSGERYSVLLDANQPINNYVMNVEIRWRKMGVTGTSLISYAGAPMLNLAPDGAYDLLEYVPKQIEATPSSTPNWILSNLKPIQKLDYYASVPKVANKEYVLIGKQSSVKHPTISNSTMLKWTINDQHLDSHFDTPLLLNAFKSKQEFWNSIPSHARGLVLEISNGDVVDVVLQNTVALNGVCEQHPWHLHGHHFWVISHGPGSYTDAKKAGTINYNLNNPIMKDSITVYPYDYAFFQTVDPVNAGKPCGWRVIRFIANNPGVWNMHCHIAAHMHMGMQVFFAESIEKLEKPTDINVFGMGN